MQPNYKHFSAVDARWQHGMYQNSRYRCHPRATFIGDRNGPEFEKPDTHWTRSSAAFGKKESYHWYYGSTCSSFIHTHTPTNRPFSTRVIPFPPSFRKLIIVFKTPYLFFFQGYYLWRINAYGWQEDIGSRTIPPTPWQHMITIATTWGRWRINVTFLIVSIAMRLSKMNVFVKAIYDGIYHVSTVHGVIIN